MATINLNVPDELLQRTKKVARERGMSVNALTKEALEQITSASHEEWWAKQKALLDQMQYTKTWKWNRDELYEDR
ncbi:MAG TPA: hypothetical protein VGE01_13420 [Fimbriimonas sp.]